jgi:DNA-binding CsgD family transcriptional regulator
VSAAAQAADLRLEPEQALALAERALELAPDDDRRAGLEAANALLTARTSSGRPPDGTDAALLERAVALLGYPELRAGSEAPHWIAYCLALHEHDEDARRLSDRALAEARWSGDVWSECFGLYARAAIEHTTGRIDGMAAWAEEALPLAEQIGEPWRVVEARTFRAAVEAERGDPDRCREALAAIGGTLAPEQDPLIRGYHLGRACIAQRLPEAIGELEAAAEHLERGGILLWYRQIPLELAEAYVHAGRRDDAAVLVDAAAPGVEASGLARPRARLARVRALLVPEARIDLAFAAAADLLEDVPHPLEHARIELCWGERLRRAGRSADAVPHLERALARFDALGAGGWAESARRELEAASGHERPRQPRRTDELTAQELRIARHAAAGLRNREIAALLYLSPRTIETHLQNAYRKLEVGNRTQLAALLAADGIRPIGAAGESAAQLQ